MTTLTLSDGMPATKGTLVRKADHEGGMVGTIEKTYRGGQKDANGVPHSKADALVRWPNGVTNYEYLDGLTRAGS